MKAPVVFFIYRRPKYTARVFERIRAYQPPVLFVVADGPKNATESAYVREAREISENVDWPCEVHRDYADDNLGLRKRVGGGISWALSTVEHAIMLEDDTLPGPDFFGFCEDLLARYAEDERVFHISGNYFQPPQNTTPHSYFFSQYPAYWGWATWRRAWQYHDPDMHAWHAAPDKSVFAGLLNDLEGWTFWRRRWERVASGVLDSYSYPWIFTCLRHGGLAIEPAENLVTNIGFGADSTHTKDPNDPLANYPIAPLRSPLQHPPVVEPFRAADTFKVTQFFYPHY